MRCPTAIGMRVRRTRMRDSERLQPQRLSHSLDRILRIAPYAHRPLRLDNLDQLPQARVAHLAQGLLLRARQLVGRQVAAVGVEKAERTIVGHKKPLAEHLRRLVPLLGPSPNAAAADLTAPIREPFHGSFGMLPRRFVYN